MLSELAKFVVTTGIILVLVGLALLVFEKTSFLGKLPGDILIKGKRFTFFFPLTTCIILSVILTIILNLLLRR